MPSHTVTLRGDKHFGRRVPSAMCGAVLQALPKAISGAIRMAFEGRSTSRGRRPQWFRAASDVRFVGLSGEDNTCLHFDAPYLGEAAEDLYRQQEIWPTKPDPEASGFDLLIDVTADIRASAVNSDRFDASLLRRMEQFSKFFGPDLSDITISGSSASEPEIAIDLTVSSEARSLYHITPKPRRVRIVGMLDMLRASTSSIGVKLSDGTDISGVMIEGEVDQYAEMLRHPVLVLGRAVYRPSGRLLRIDVEQLRAAHNESEVWANLPSVSRRDEGVLDLTRLRRQQGPRSGLRAIVGKWPGDESDQEVAAALEQMS